MIMAKLHKSSRRKCSYRTKINSPREPQGMWSREKIREVEDWLLRSGLSPWANRSVSEIGIYTDFT